MIVVTVIVAVVVMVMGVVVAVLMVVGRPDPMDWTYFRSVLIISQMIRLRVVPWGCRQGGAVGG